jgi:formylglycine-generating enzyme required for sulfatase activity
MVPEFPIPGLRYTQREMETLRNRLDVARESLLVYVPGTGPGEGGSASGQEAAGGIASFHVGRTEVTNAQYAFFVAETGHRPPIHWVDGHVPEGQEDFPVVEVTPLDAEAYCAWAGGRLLTVAEWVRAAVGDERMWEFPWEGYSGKEEITMRANFSGRLAPVGSYPLGDSRFGARDMAGNAAEITIRDLESGMYVLKGGDFSSYSPAKAAQVRQPPESMKPESHRPEIGFRVRFPG